MKTHIAVLSFLLMFSCVSSVSARIVVQAECSFEFLEQSTDAEVSQILSELKQEALRKCTYGQDGLVDYLVASKVRELDGVSYFELRRAFHHDGTWKLYPPSELSHMEVIQTYMLNRPGPDVLPDDDGFVRVNGLTPGQFRQFSDSWNEITSSREAYSTAISKLGPWERLLFGMNDFEELVVDLSDPLRLKEIDFHRGAAFAEGDALDFPHFSLVVSNTSTTYTLHVDFDETGIKIHSLPQTSVY
jgi:hypothetical protein